MGEKQRAGGDGEQNQHEGDAPGQAQLGAVEPAGQRGKRQGEQRQEEGGSDTHRVSLLAGGHKQNISAGRVIRLLCRADCK